LQHAVSSSVDASSSPVVLDLSDADFDATIRTASTPVLVDVWARWCGPCRLMAPLMAWAADAYAGQLLVVKLEADPNPLSRDACGVQGLPTLLLFRNGNQVARHEGAMSQPQLKVFLDAHL
jgi:thioredoxin 1